MASRRVEVVGAGISGAACARVLADAGVEVVVRERGRAPGGRLAAPTLHGRRVDLGAAYLTVSDDSFADVVAGWERRGLARPWTDTIDVAGAAPAVGPMRWAAPDGLRALVRDLLIGVEMVTSDEVTSDGDAAAVVLAMPDPQAARIATLPGVAWVEYEPVLALAAGFPARSWAMADAMFVNDDPDLAFVADDGARRGDGAPVLVLHSSAELARAHLGDPDAAVRPLLAAAARTLELDVAPDWTHVHRWTFAKPTGTHGDAPFHLDGRVGVCGDSWCPSGSPRVEAAWLSGHRLGTALAARLAP